jgi:hypothetical protein
MVSSAVWSEIDRMPLDERRNLALAILETTEPSDRTPTESERSIVADAVRRFRYDPSQGIAWEDLRAELTARLPR